MTPAQVAHIMALVDKFAEACVRPVTLENVKIAQKAREAVEAALRDAPQAAPIAEARKADDVDRLLHQVFLLCEAVEDAPAIAPKNEHERGFDRGRRFEAKQIRRAIGDWFQWTFCGRSFMGEPVLAATPSAPTAVEPDESLKWCSYCGEGVTTFCRGKQSPDWDYKCPVLNLPARASKGTP